MYCTINGNLGSKSSFICAEMALRCLRRSRQILDRFKTRVWTFCPRLHTVSPITYTPAMSDIILRSKVAASSGVITSFRPRFKEVDVAPCSSCSSALLALVLSPKTALDCRIFFISFDFLCCCLNSSSFYRFLASFFFNVISTVVITPGRRGSLCASKN